MVTNTVSGRYLHGPLPTGLTPSSVSQAKNHIYLFTLQPSKYEILSHEVELTHNGVCVFQEGQNKAFCL